MLILSNNNGFEMWLVYTVAVILVRLWSAVMVKHIVLGSLSVSSAVWATHLAGGVGAGICNVLVEVGSDRFVVCLLL